MIIYLLFYKMAEIIDSREKIDIYIDECLICCNTIKCLICTKCQYKACMSCIEQFIISSDSAECFHCGYQYNEEILSVIFDKEIVEKVVLIDDDESDESDDDKLDEDNVEEKEKEKKVKKVIVKKVVDNKKLFSFRSRKLFDMEKLLFNEDLKYVNIKQKVELLLGEYEEFIGYRYDFISSFYNNLYDNGNVNDEIVRIDHKFLPQVETWYNIEVDIISRFYSRSKTNGIFSFINIVKLLDKLNTKYSGIYRITDDIKERVEKYHEMNLRLTCMVIILNRHINVLSKCKRGFNSTCEISENINTDFTNCKDLYNENTLSLRLYVDDGDVRDNIGDTKKAIIKCPADQCSGFLNNYKCIICLKITCSKCLFIHDKRVGDEYNEYGCKNDDIETIKLIRAETKKCPSCSSLIYRISGCNQMWCTMCHTGFNWNTGKIEVNIHNPHYFEWLRDTGRQEEGIIPNNYRNHYASLNRLYDNIVIQQSNLYLRFKFLTGIINEEQFCKKLYNNYKSNELNRKLRELITVTITVFVELANQRYNSMIDELRLLFNEIIEYYFNVYNTNIRRYYLGEDYQLLYRL